MHGSRSSDAAAAGGGANFSRRAFDWAIEHRNLLLPTVVTIVAAVQTSYLLRWSVRVLGEHGVGVDDAYFYAILAQNYDKLGYLTFDGSMPTNGVQPLWQGLLIALHELLPWVDVMRLSYTSSWFLYAVVTWLTVRYALSLRLQHALPGALTLAVLVTCNPAFQRLVLCGLETPLFLACYLTLLHRLAAFTSKDDRGRSGDARAVAVLAFLAGLTFLARTDWFWATFLVAIFVWRKTQHKGLFLLFGAVASAVVVPYLAHNWLTYGHLVPISGRAKLVALEQFAPGIFAYLQTDEWQGLFAMVADVFTFDQLWLAIPGAIAMTVMGIREFPRASSSVRFLLIGSACHSLFLHLAYREVRPYTRYYFVVEALSVGVLLVVLVDRALVRLGPDSERAQRRVVGATLGLAALVAVEVGMALLGLRPRESWKSRIRMADTLQTLPNMAPIAAFWPGTLAYFSNRPVLPLDGIIGSEEYLERFVTRGKELEYARARGVRYVVVADMPLDVLYARGAPEIRNWANIGKLRLWQDCVFVKGLVAVHADPKTKNGWYLYELTDRATNRACRSR